MLFACRFFFPLHDPGISEELVILNRRGLAAVSARSYALITTGLLLLAGVVFLALGSAPSFVQESAASPAFVADSTPVQSVFSNLPVSLRGQSRTGFAGGQIPRARQRLRAATHPWCKPFLTLSSGQSTGAHATGERQPRARSKRHTILSLAKPTTWSGKTPAMAPERADNSPAFATQRVSRSRFRLLRKQGKLEYDFEIAPAADPSQVGLHFQGADNMALSPEGDLIFAEGCIAFSRPASIRRWRPEASCQGRFVIHNNRGGGIRSRRL